jgi:hypothetical protein
VKCQTIAGRYEDLFSEALNDMQERGHRPAPTFAFVDPFGYSDASMQLTDRLLRFERCEALIYMPLPSITRFIGRAGQEDAMDGLFGTDRWREAIPLQGEERKRFLHDLFRDQLAAEGADRLVRSFEIPTASGTGYHLFFTTGHEKGLEVIKDAMWAVDPIEGQRYRDSADADQLMIFGSDVDTGPLLAGLRTHFGVREFTIEEATSYTIRESAFRSSHLKTKTLVPAEKAQQLEVLTTRSRACTYPPGTRMQFIAS